MTKSEKLMSFIYPQQYAKIFIPTELNEQKGEVVFEATHKKKTMTVFWHLDDQYLGSTNLIHQMGLQPKTGKHKLTLVDENGNFINQNFEIVDE